MILKIIVVNEPLPSILYTYNTIIQELISLIHIVCIPNYNHYRLKVGIMNTTNFEYCKLKCISLLVIPIYFGVRCGYDFIDKNKNNCSKMNYRLKNASVKFICAYPKNVLTGFSPKYRIIY